MHGRQDRDGLLGHVDAGEDPGALGDARQALGQDLGIQVVEVQVDVILVRTHPASLADLDGHGPADHVPGRQVLHGGRIALHEAFTLGIGQVAALAPGALGDQAAGAVDTGGVELDELHVLQGQSGAQGHAAAIPGAGMGAGGREVGPAVAARGQDHHLALETVQGAVVQLPGGHTPADALVHDQVEGEILDEELGVVGQGLAVHGVQHGVTRAVRRGAGALDGGLAEVTGHAAEGALIDLAIRGAREGYAPVLEFVDRRGSVPAEVFDGVLVAQPIRPLDGVVHVPAPVILAHIAEAGRDAALGRHSVRAGREDLGDAGGLQARLGAAEGGAEAGAAGADDDDVELVIGKFVNGHDVRERLRARP